MHFFKSLVLAGLALSQYSNSNGEFSLFGDEQEDDYQVGRFESFQASAPVTMRQQSINRRQKARANRDARTNDDHRGLGAYHARRADELEESNPSLSAKKHTKSADAFAYQGNHELAANRYNKAALLNTKHTANLHTKAGESYEQAGNFAEAARSHAKAGDHHDLASRGRGSAREKFNHGQHQKQSHQDAGRLYQLAGQKALERGNVGEAASHFKKGSKAFHKGGDEDKGEELSALHLHHASQVPKPRGRNDEDSEEVGLRRNIQYAGNFLNGVYHDDDASGSEFQGDEEDSDFEGDEDEEN